MSSTTEVDAYASWVRGPKSGLGPTERDLTSLFSSVTYKDLAGEHPARALDRLARACGLPNETENPTIADAFEIAHQRLLRAYRNEYVFKNAVVSKIVFGRHRPSTASALLELGMGNSFADVAVFNGTSSVYEIKTDLDSFARLPTQLADYRTRAEFVHVVVSNERAAAAEKIVPNGVGLLALRRNGSLTVVREAESNRDRLDVEHLFGMLRQGEANQILKAELGWTPPTGTGNLWRATRDVFTTLDVGTAHSQSVAALRARGARSTAVVTDPVFPPSARALAYATELTGVGARRLLQRLAQPASLLWGR